MVATLHELACLALILASTACPAPDEGESGGTASSSESSGSASSSASVSSTTSASTMREHVGIDERRDCRRITCRPYVMTDNGQVAWCLGEAEYLGCQSADIGCDDARTIACAGDDAPTYVCPDSCIPPEAMECEPPVEGQIPECP